MTLGEERVGIGFNPSGNELVDQIKRASADLIDLVEELPDNRMDFEIARLKEFAQTAFEEAAMWAVKAATKR